ncbi:MAG: hypothetical protein RIG61_06255 [Deltaproteobacteria bacterium]
MYLEELVALFESASDCFPQLKNERTREELRLAIRGKKYDLQDKALIEAIIRDDSEEITDSFLSGLEKIRGNLDKDRNMDDYLKSTEGTREAINIYIASLEHLINFYYNNLVGKHFSST